MVNALRQLTKCAGGRFSRLTYFPFVSVAACWKIGCILLHTPHPATKIQNTAEDITENSMGNTAMTASIQLSKAFPSSARRIVFFFESSLQCAFGCEIYDIVKSSDYNNWTLYFWATTGDKTLNLCQLNMTVVQLVSKQLRWSFIQSTEFLNTFY